MWEIIELGVINFEDAYKLQIKFHEQVKQGDTNKLLLLQHHPVITLGRRTENSHLLISKAELAKKGVDLIKTNRGGSATYHGYGQLVGYIICKVNKFKGIHEVVSNILQVVNSTINEFFIESWVDTDNPGIWVGNELPRKIAAVGMHNKDGVSMHGFAVNINMKLDGFSLIIPCGLNLPVTTVSIEAGKNISVEEFKDKLITAFLQIFE